MKLFLPSLLTSRVPLEKSNVVLILNSLDMLFFSWVKFLLIFSSSLIF